MVGWRWDRQGRGFTLVELLAATVVVGVLLAASASLFRPNHARSRDLAVDQICAAIDHARGTAASRRESVLLAWNCETQDAPLVLRMGCFRVIEGPNAEREIKVAPVGRWQNLPAGVVLAKGSEGSLRNLLDVPPWRLRREGHDDVMAHGVVIDPQGKMRAPLGKDPLLLRVAEGFYQNDGEARCLTRNGAVPESRIRIGRVCARPWRETF